MFLLQWYIIGLSQDKTWDETPENCDGLRIADRGLMGLMGLIQNAVIAQRLS